MLAFVVVVVGGEAVGLKTDVSLVVFVVVVVVVVVAAVESSA